MSLHLGYDKIKINLNGVVYCLNLIPKTSTTVKVAIEEHSIINTKSIISPEAFISCSSVCEANIEDYSVI